MSTTARTRKARHRSGPPLGREFRRFSASGLEVRSSTDSDTITISGLFIRYGEPYQVNDMFGTFTETMHPGVLTGVLAAAPDVRFLFNHDGMPHARTLNGTMTIDDVRAGGQIDAQFDARRADSQDLAFAIERGDITQMSCGFIVNRDEWSGEDEHGLPDTRDVFGFEELFDVSAVTYPASPTTSVELAYRALNAMPVESRARVRNLYTVTRELRQGGELSAPNAQAFAATLEALHNADDVDYHATVREANDTSDLADTVVHMHDATTTDPLDGTNDTDDDGTTGGEPADGENDGTGVRAMPTTAAARREASLSFGDQRTLVYQSLLNHLGALVDPDDDGDVDVWICDLSSDWVVYECYSEPGAGMYRLPYSIDADGAVIFDGDPVQVTCQTQYVPVVEEKSRNLTGLRLEAEQLRLHGRRMRAA